MKKTLSLAIAAIMLATTNAYAARVDYEVNLIGDSLVNPGNTIWRYDYTVNNESTSPFDIALFDLVFLTGVGYETILDANAALEWVDPLLTGEEAIILPLDTTFGDGFVNFESLGDPSMDILPGQTLSGFSVLIEWSLANIAPGADHHFAILDPNTFDTLQFGPITPLSPVPLPAAAWLFLTGLAGMGIFKSRKSGISS